MEVLTAAGSIVSAASEGGFHAPTIEEFFPKAFLLEGTPFEFNRIMMLRVISTIVICAIFWIAASRLKLVPSRGQSLAEMAMDFVRVSIAEETMGKEKAAKFLPLITTIFFMVVAMNITGVIPFLNIAGTSVVGVPLLLALIVYVTYHAAGIKSQGLGGYLKTALILPGAPPAMHVLLIPIEFLTKFVIQPFTLTIRLLANMLVGHLLLVLAFGATWFFFFDASLGFKAFGFITFLGGFFVTLLEILIAVLQAYIFALLASVYINQATEAEH
ncbi:F0F1 ATP synthase subunit A [Saxibacter everestensis]|uniref:ATP synthase subunit a n=1 Tax=Saxibacter everestensis TaxID=2909229 RepID=A0ABY8QNV1_9MICO|nr:F0F1 ATP synthase subunit A [Brevibacteriaceae bacterium ZFBP1038]